MSGGALSWANHIKCPKANQRNGCRRTVERPTPGLCRRHREAIAWLGVRYCALESFDAAWAATARFVQDFADKPGTLARLPEKSVAFN